MADRIDQTGGAAVTPETPDSADIGGGMPPAPAVDADAGGSNVLLTVLKNDDGSYQLIEGDEGEGGEGGEVAADPEAGAPGAAGQMFETGGELLKGIFDLLKADEAGGADEEFDAGFNGGSDASPAKKPLDDKTMG